MKRDDYVWLAVRLAGIFLLVRAIIEVPVALGAIATYGALQSAFASTLGSDPELTNTLLKSMAASRGFSAPIAAVLYLVLGAYFVRGAPALTSVMLRGEHRERGAA